MEEHFVNVSATGGETVVAVFLKLGAHNNALDPILNAAAPSLTTPNSKTTIDHPDRLRRAPADEPRRAGSTRVADHAAALAAGQLVRLHDADHARRRPARQYEQVAGQGGFLPNTRPVQPTDGRVAQRDRQQRQLHRDATSPARTSASSLDRIGQADRADVRRSRAGAGSMAAAPALAACRVTAVQ